MQFCSSFRLYPAHSHLVAWPRCTADGGSFEGEHTAVRLVPRAFVIIAKKVLHRATGDRPHGDNGFLIEWAGLLVAPPLQFLTHFLREKITSVKDPIRITMMSQHERYRMERAANDHKDFTYASSGLQLIDQASQRKLGVAGPLCTHRLPLRDDVSQNFVQFLGEDRPGILLSAGA